MLAHRKWIHFELMAFVLIGLSVGRSHAYGQSSFLEKLEAAVRDRLAEANPTAQPSSSASAAGQVTEEELPSPQATPPGTGDPMSKGPTAPVSVLERDTPSLPLAGSPSPPPMSGNSRAGDAPPAAGRIYLGLEAEEITGGGIGVRVTKVTEGSPAWKGGFRTGDRIAGINGFAIANLDTMVERLGKAAPGETVKFLVNRNDRNMELVAVLMDAELASRIAAIPGSPTELSSSDGAPGNTPWLGVIVNDLTPEFRKQFGLTVFRGAAITSVTANSPASKIGMVAGDAIIAVAGTPIETARDLTLWMNSARPGQKVEVTYQRGTAARTLPLTLEVTPESRAANRNPLTEPVRSRPNRSAGAPAESGTATAGEAPLDLAASTATPSQNQIPPRVPAMSLPAEPPTGSKVSDVVPNVVPVPAVPATPGAAAPESSTAEVSELRREVARLRAELEKANQRLESTQSRLQKIIEGLGKE